MDRPSIPILTRPVQIFSKLFGVFPVTISLRTSVIAAVYSLATLMLSCTHLYFLPSIVDQMERKLAHMKYNSYTFFLKMLFPTVVLITGSVSKINCLCVARPNLKRYCDRIGRVDARLPILAEDVERHRRYSANVLCAIILLTLPINLIRLQLFYRAHTGWAAILLFAHMYFQNIATAMHETQFTTLIYGLVLRARKINDRLRGRLKNADFYFRVKFGSVDGVETNELCGARGTASFDGVKRSFGGAGERRSMADSVTELRRMHEDVCDAAYFVQRAYGVAVLFSLCCVGLMLLFDIYFELYGFIGGDVTRPSFATYVWCVQYSVRFILMAQLPQKMYEEGLKTRYLISNLNNRFLDPDCKEELSLFANHITNARIALTACDFFTLNSRLITSAIAAGTTYLVILVQFHTDKDS